MIGSDKDDQITVTPRDNRNFGGDGDDLLLGRGGSDYLMGIFGANTLEGGTGDDRLQHNRNDVVERWSRRRPVRHGPVAEIRRLVCAAEPPRSKPSPGRLTTSVPWPSSNASMGRPSQRASHRPAVLLTSLRYTREGVFVFRPVSEEAIITSTAATAIDTSQRIQSTPFVLLSPPKAS